MRNKLLCILLFLLLVFLCCGLSLDFQEFAKRIKNMDNDVLYFKSYDGTSIAYRIVKTDNSKATLIFIHGISVYGKYYLPFAKALADLGIKVYLPDIRGHGRSEGRRGDSPDFKSLSEDMYRFYEIVRMENPGLPVYLGGHSMGAALTLKYFMEYNLNPAGLILISGGLPVEKISTNSNNILKIKNTTKIFQFLSFLFPHFRIISWDLPEGVEDKLLVNNYSLTFFKSAFPDSVKKIWDSLYVPTLVVVGDRDKFYNRDELFKIAEKYKRNNITFVILQETDHFDVLEKSIGKIYHWILGGSKDGRL